MWVLSIPLHGNEDVVVRHLLRPGKTYKIGRAEGNDFLLSKQSISKLHLEIRVGGFNSSSVSNRLCFCKASHACTNGVSIGRSPGGRRGLFDPGDHSHFQQGYNGAEPFCF
ncbi:unnamed protein product [Kuraishia capsulata CBS 1993]|uniref:FHA domain-containing protein n=1 Tax=Kuraishia capsulata CBS 1993 TaxID=1382522 RepID=W6MMY0_9ASCO|nr:uncharacterized protein KUCA_T00003541001 [Kuraishia capsulata CBS 1993]CDK27563.1 unnamed protein product [Kuraishia capsulata CBS 1993]